MTWFLIAAALLTILVLGPLLYVLLRPEAAIAVDDPGSKKRQALAAARAAGVISQDEYDQKLAALKSEPEAPAAAKGPAPARQLALVLALLVPISLYALYQQFGTAAALDPANLVASADNANSNGGPAPTLEQAIASLEQKMADNPDDLEGWRLLARAKQSQQDFAGSLAALEKARALATDNLDVQVEYAEALALSGAERRIDGEAQRLLEAALSRDNQHQRALWLLGIAAVQRGDKPAAIDYWQRLQSQLPADSQIRQAVDQQLAELTGEPVATPAPTAPEAAESAPAGPGIRVKVALDPALQSKVGANAVLYVFARPAQGPKMPLAIQRLPVSVLPADLTLDDSMGMMPSMKLSGTPEIVIGARISQSGVANAQSGDLEGLTGTLQQTSINGPIEITISQVVP